MACIRIVSKGGWSSKGERFPICMEILAREFFGEEDLPCSNLLLLGLDNCILYK